MTQCSRLDYIDDHHRVLRELRSLRAIGDSARAMPGTRLFALKERLQNTGGPLPFLHLNWAREFCRRCDFTDDQYRLVVRMYASCGPAIWLEPTGEKAAILMPGEWTLPIERVMA